MSGRMSLCRHFKYHTNENFIHGPLESNVRLPGDAKILTTTLPTASGSMCETLFYWITSSSKTLLEGLLEEHDDSVQKCLCCMRLLVSQVAPWHSPSRPVIRQAFPHRRSAWWKGPFTGVKWQRFPWRPRELHSSRREGETNGFGGVQRGACVQVCGVVCDLDGCIVLRWQLYNDCFQEAVEGVHDCLGSCSHQHWLPKNVDTFKNVLMLLK